MRSLKMLAGVLPTLVLAACLDEAPISEPTNPTEFAAASTSRGAVIAQSLCAPCHGATYSGGGVDGVPCPSLSVVKSYSFAQFEALLTTGVAPSGGDTNGFMTVTRSLTPSDREAVHQYLRTYYDQ